MEEADLRAPLLIQIRNIQFYGGNERVVYTTWNLYNILLLLYFLFITTHYMTFIIIMSYYFDSTAINYQVYVFLGSYSISIICSTITYITSYINKLRGGETMIQFIILVEFFTSMISGCIYIANYNYQVNSLYDIINSYLIIHGIIASMIFLYMYGNYVFTVIILFFRCIIIDCLLPIILIIFRIICYVVATIINIACCLFL